MDNGFKNVKYYIIFFKTENLSFKTSLIDNYRLISFFFSFFLIFLIYLIFFLKKKKLNNIYNLFFLITFIFIYSYFLIFCLHNLNLNNLRFFFLNFFDKKVFLLKFFKGNFQIFFFLISNLLLIISFSIIFNFQGNKKVFNIIICLYFFFISFFFFFSNNLLVFFLLYELFLIPSFFIVNFLSSNKKSLNCSYYFLIWTQVGSLFVFLGLVYIIYTIDSYKFDNFYFSNKFSNTERYSLFFFFFLGFGFKVPIWPFHYWLTKTHVESTAGFSIYLSGFLVKTALFGFYKLTNYLISSEYLFFFLSICLFSVMDSSLKFWMQTDLKKLVAYCTVQEMNCIYFLICLNDSYNYFIILNFCLSHSILSCFMFFLVDCIQKRYNSRSVIEVTGIFSVTPNLGMFVFFLCIIYSGIPFSFKFYCEIYFFISVIDNSMGIFFVTLLITNVIGIIGFCRNWFEVVFGSSKYRNVNDLDKKEIIILSFLSVSCILPIFFL